MDNEIQEMTVTGKINYLRQTKEIRGARNKQKSRQLAKGNQKLTAIDKFLMRNSAIQLKVLERYKEYIK
jgi:hypothetical protein